MLAKLGIQGSMLRMLPLDPRVRGVDDTAYDPGVTFANLRNVVPARKTLNGHMRGSHASAKPTNRGSAYPADLRPQTQQALEPKRDPALGLPGRTDDRLGQHAAGQQAPNLLATGEFLRCGPTCNAALCDR